MTDHTLLPLKELATPLLTLALYLCLASIFISFILVPILILMIVVLIEYKRLECSSPWVGKVRRTLHPYGGCCCGSCIDDRGDQEEKGTRRDWGFEKETDRKIGFGKLFRDIENADVVRLSAAAEVDS